VILQPGSDREPIKGVGKPAGDTRMSARKVGFDLSHQVGALAQQPLPLRVIDPDERRFREIQAAGSAPPARIVGGKHREIPDHRSTLHVKNTGPSDPGRR